MELSPAFCFSALGVDSKCHERSWGKQKERTVCEEINDWLYYMQHNKEVQLIRWASNNYIT